MLLHLQDSGGARPECLDGALVVALQDDSRVPQPTYVGGCEPGTVVILVVALLGHDMREDALALHAADDEALDDRALSSGVFQCCFVVGRNG